ncbi:MAG: hypothetical protein QX197_05085 [Methylococcaceae bacterium]
MIKKLFLVSLLILSNIAHADVVQFSEYKNFYGDRSFLAQIPSNFNGRLVIMFHGSAQLANGWLTGTYTAAFISMAISSGFGIVLPNARTNYVVGGYFYPRWESETKLNPDVDFINDIIDKLVPFYNQSVTSEKTIKKIFLLGGVIGRNDGFTYCVGTT